MTGREITPAQVSVVLDAMIHDFQAAFPGIGREAAAECLVAMSEIMRDCDTASEAEAVFLERVRDAEDQCEPWAVAVRQAIKRKERSAT